jgi:hypothetical protein
MPLCVLMVCPYYAQRRKQSVYVFISTHLEFIWDWQYEGLSHPLVDSTAVLTDTRRICFLPRATKLTCLLRLWHVTSEA